MSGSSKLVKNILLRKWKKVRNLLGTKEGIKQAKEEFQKGLTILSIAASRDPPIDIISTLIRIEPLHTLQADNYGMLPLHIACMNGACVDTIKTVLDHDVGACAQAIDVMKRSPLHYAVQYVCQPFRKDLDVGNLSSLHSSQASKEHSLMTSLTSKRNSSRGFRSDDCSTMTMSQDRFQEQMQVIKILIQASPDIVNFADINNNTPIDILQDCKAENSGGSKWERADICCEVLRKIAIREYREQKLVSEMKGYSCKHFPPNSAVPRSEHHSGSSSSKSLVSKNTLVSGASNISRLETDAVSYNRMDLSCDGDDGTLDTRNGGWKMSRRGVRNQVVKEDEEMEDCDMDMS